MAICEVSVEVAQTIDYAYHDHVDEFFHEDRAELIELQSFTRLTYTDQWGHPIHIKWNALGNVVEVKQPHTTLRFNEEVVTRCEYHSPKGTMIMDLMTQRIAWEKLNNQVKLSINYQLAENERPLGDYFFQLIYHV